MEIDSDPDKSPDPTSEASTEKAKIKIDGRMHHAHVHGSM